MKDLIQRITRSLRDREYAEGYAESFQDTYLATQIKVIREERNLSQAELSKLIGTTQGGISRIEDASYSGWTVKTLKKIARALNVRLRISLEEYGTLPAQAVSMSKESLMRNSHERDPVLFPEKYTIANTANAVVMNQASRSRISNLSAAMGSVSVTLTDKVGRLPPTDLIGIASARANVNSLVGGQHGTRGSSAARQA